VCVSVCVCVCVSVCVRVHVHVCVCVWWYPSPLHASCCNRLRDKCEVLLLTPGLPQRRKVEELLWKKAFYDVIQKCRASRKVHRHCTYILKTCEVVHTVCTLELTVHTYIGNWFWCVTGSGSNLSRVGWHVHQMPTRSLVYADMKLARARALASFG